MRNTRFKIAEKDIISFFDNNNQKVFLYTELSKILEDNKDFWRLPINLSVKKFIDLLMGTKILKSYKFEFPNKKILRFSWGDVSDFLLIQSLFKNSYFSHYTAMFFNNLTNQIPKTIYLNFEQAKKNVRKEEMLQKNIDIAFSRQARTSNNIAIFGNYRICILNGKHTNNLGVTEFKTQKAENLFVTGIERTLIDITVRPSYAGGVYEVLQAYKLASTKVSINKLVAILKEIDYTYPYHQAIGFYLEKSGSYKEAQIELLKK